MFVSIESLQPGETLYCVARRNRVGERQGRLRVRTVVVHSVNVEAGTVLASRNGAAPREWAARNGRMSWQRSNPAVTYTGERDKQVEAWLAGG